MTVLLAGASGTIGRAVVRHLVAAGADVLCPLRPGAEGTVRGAETITCALAEPGALRDALKGRRISAVLSCISTRGGAPADAWAVDHAAQVTLLQAAAEAGAHRFVLLSAICVQKPVLAFQQAKLAFETHLQSSGLDWTIVRPTAFFKSLSGQVARVQAGKRFLVFGNGALTACKPISDRDLARFLCQCLEDKRTIGQVLPIGGPGPALTPLAQAEMVFDLMGQAPRIRHVSPRLMDAIVGGLSLAGRVVPSLRDKAEFARTGRYYASESMLLWDPVAERYDAAATPEFGADRLRDHYAALLAGRAEAALGAHAVF